jgi:hypothetical protein
MRELQIVVVTILSLCAGCRSPSQEPSRSTEPAAAAPATTAAPAPRPTDTPDDGAPGVVAPSNRQTEWWCTAIDSQEIGFCEDDTRSCESQRKAMMDKQPRFPMPPCAKTTEATCFHHTYRGAAARTCFPTLAICNFMRDSLVRHNDEVHADACTTFGTASTAPAPH